MEDTEAGDLLITRPVYFHRKTSRVSTEWCVETRLVGVVERVTGQAVVQLDKDIAFG